MSTSRLSASVVLAAVLCGAPTASAIVINKFRAPQELIRPADSAAYGFLVQIEATTGAGDGAGGTVPLVYRSWLGSWGAGTTDLVDAVDLIVPAGLAAGTKLRANRIMGVGCHPLPETFGPVTGGQGTGMDPMIGEFWFPTLGKAFGALGDVGGAGKNRCVCLELSNNPNLPPPAAENRYQDDLHPYDKSTPWPGYPGGIVPPQILLERVPCDGDVDGNFTVDQDDLDLVLFNFGFPVPPGESGDLDGDGDVDQDDLDLILFNFGCQN